MYDITEAKTEIRIIESIVNINRGSRKMTTVWRQTTESEKNNVISKNNVEKQKKYAVHFEIIISRFLLPAKDFFLNVHHPRAENNICFFEN